MDIRHQIVLIVGGASGMGLETAQFLSSENAHVVVWDMKAQKPTQLTENTLYFQCDITDDAMIERTLAETIHVLGVPRIIVQCAGVAPAKRVISKTGKMPLSDFTSVIQINLIGTFNIIRHLAEAVMKTPLVNEEERGIFIQTASIAAYEGQIGQSAYSASKGGVVALTLPLAREFASMGIRVNTIAPGLISTPLLLGISEEVQTNLIKSVPFPKRFGKSSEFALLVKHLIENPFINGEVIRLDGGLRMQ